MKELYNYQEIGTLIDQGQQVAFTCHPVARVTVVQREGERDAIHMTIDLSLGEYHIAAFEEAYPSILRFVKVFADLFPAFPLSF